MPTENARKRARKQIILPSGDQMYVPVITEIDFIDLVGDPSAQAVRWAVGQEFDYSIDNTAQSGRTVHVDELDPIDVNPDGTPTDPNNPPTPGTDTSQQLAVERIDTWPIVSLVERGQEFDFNPDNKTGADKQPPSFTTHEKTHIYRYYQDPQNPDDGGVWIDSELIDQWGFVDGPNRGQESEFVLNNQTNAQFQGGDLSGQADPSDPDITIGGGTDGDGVSGEGTVDNPVRLDPFQNLVNFNIGSNFLLGGTDATMDSLVDYPTAHQTNWSNLVYLNHVPHSVPSPVTGLAYGKGVWIALVPVLNEFSSVIGTDFYQSRDSGKSWSNIFTATAPDQPLPGLNDAPDQIVFADGTFVAINTSNQSPGHKGSGASIWMSTDGTTWDEFDSPVNAPLAASSLSIANKTVFIGVADLSTGGSFGPFPATAYYFLSTDPLTLTWMQSGTAFNNLQGQTFGSEIPVSQVLPGNVAYSNDKDVYAASAQYASNGFSWLTVCASADGLSWGDGKQFGDFTTLHGTCGLGPLTDYIPNFQNYNCTWGRTNPTAPNDLAGQFMVPCVVQTSNQICDTGVPGPGPNDFTSTQYGLDYSQNDIGLLVSADGSSWTFQKIIEGPMAAVAGGGYNFPILGPGTEFVILTAYTTAVIFGAIVSWSPARKQFLFINSNLEDFAVTMTFHDHTPPNQTSSGKNETSFWLSNDGTTWAQVADFLAPDQTTATTPSIDCIGLGPVPTTPATAMPPS